MYRYTVGKRTFYQRGRTPNKNNVSLFLNGVLPLIESQGYTAHVVGRVLYDAANTIDLDIMLTGDIKDYKKLDELFHELYSYGFDTAEVILDLKWVSDVDTIGLDINGDPKHKNVDFVVIRHFKLISDTDNWEIEHISPDYTDVSDWLVRGNFLNYKPLTKSYQIESVKRHGRFKSVEAREFLKNIDNYLT